VNIVHVVDSNTYTFENAHNELIVYIAMLNGTGLPTVRFRNGNTTVCSIVLNPGNITINNNANHTESPAVFSSTATFPVNSWNFFEIRAIISSGSNNGSIQLKNNGQLLFSASNISTNGSNVPAFANAFRILNTVSLGNIYYDDLLILNATGSSFNGPIGNGNFYMLSYAPSASGFYTEMTSSGATTDANAINERPHNNDTSYLIATSSGTFPLRETFTLRPVGSGSEFLIPVSASIEAILKDSVVRAVGPDLMGVEHLLRVNSTDYTGSTPISASITYTDQFTGWTINPNTGNKFTPTEFNSLEVGFRRDS
jgi:hypothetical protein